MTKYRSIVFDVDSTIVTIEGLVEIATKKGLNGEIDRITQAGMNGELSFADSINQRLQIVRPSAADVNWLGDWYVQHLTPGVEEVINTLRTNGVEVFLISGSYLPALYTLGNYLQIPSDHIAGLELQFDEHGYYQGYDKNQLLLDAQGKRLVLENLNPPREIAFVGDGATDLVTQQFVDVFIGFGGITQHTVVKETANFFIEENDFKNVLQFL
jgi:phosphoserine phosphatase